MRSHTATGTVPPPDDSGNFVAPHVIRFGVRDGDRLALVRGLEPSTVIEFAPRE